MLGKDAGMKLLGAFLFVVATIGIGALARLAGAADRLSEARQIYVEKVARTYNYRFGKGQPFLPSNAKIAGDTFIQAGAFPTAQYCRGCHEATYQQWRQSLHANSFRTPFYTKNVGLLQNTKGMEFSRHCEGCHNPIELFSGLVTSHPVSNDREFDQDGVTCMVCHSIAKLQPTYGVGSYVMGIPAVMVDEHGAPIPGKVPYDQIFDHVERHKAAVMKDFYRTPEYCAACHKANIPRSLDDYKWLRAIGLYDEWQKSSYSQQSPLTFYKKDYRSCQDCHMPGEQVPEGDAAAVRGTIHSHRWVAGNTAVPFLYGYQDQLSKTVAYLKHDRLNIDLFALGRMGGSGLIAPFGSTAFELNPNDMLQVYVVIQNKGIGHSLIPEQRDMYQAWVEFDLTDQDGKIIESSGRLDSQGNLDPKAHCFMTSLLDRQGRLLVQHEIWNRRSIATDATIAPGRSTLVRYAFRIPKVGAGPYTITAKVNYRHFDEVFTNFVLGENHPQYPVVEMAARSSQLKIGKNEPVTPDPQDTPEWMRWNNFGIALLDEGRYTEAKDAFSQVLKLRADYADGYTNLAIAMLQCEEYQEAGESLAQALRLIPNDARATYYQAVVARNEGHLKAAVEYLKKVVSAFPSSVDAHRELAYCFYLQHRDGPARAEYESVQAIDPDDLSSHFYLALLYRRLGESAKADIEETAYEDEKPDPMASTSALRFLRNRSEMSEEGSAWHLHFLK